MAMNGMPTSAAATGLVDHVVPVEGMPAKLAAYQEHLSNVAAGRMAKASPEDWQEHLSRISALLAQLDRARLQPATSRIP